MSRILYVDACAGASGDMLAGALLDLGWPLSELAAMVESMGLAGEVAVSEDAQMHQGLAARRLEVQDLHHHQQHHAPHHHRHLADVLALLERLPEPVGEAAARVFRRLAEAEARVHGAAVEDVHFHEVGALDAIVDVTAFCAGLAWLGRPRLVVSPLPLGRGFVNCAHGRLPLPAPAVMNLLVGAPISPWPAEEETVTPTGAALLTTLADAWGGLPAMRLTRVGVGGGSRTGSHAPNVCRLFLGSEGGEILADSVVEIVCHLDDMSPEDLPVALESLIAAGALDAAAAPLAMKKGRMGLALTVLAAPERAEELAALVLEQTSSLGVRLRTLERRLAPRRVVEVQGPWGPARVKVAQVGRTLRLHPEADDVARICRQTGLPPAEVRRRLEDAARGHV